MLLNPAIYHTTLYTTLTTAASCCGQQVQLSYCPHKFERDLQFPFLTLGVSVLLFLETVFNLSFFLQFLHVVENFTVSGFLGSDWTKRRCWVMTSGLQELSTCICCLHLFLFVCLLLQKTSCLSNQMCVQTIRNVPVNPNTLEKTR